MRTEPRAVEAALSPGWLTPWRRAPTPPPASGSGAGCERPPLWSWRQASRPTVQFAAKGGPVGEIGALSSKTAALAEPGQATLRLMLLEKDIDRLADQGALTGAAAQSQGLQSLALRLGETDLGAQHRTGIEHHDGSSPHPAHAVAVAQQGAIDRELAQPLPTGLSHQQADDATDTTSPRSQP